MRVPVHFARRYAPPLIVITQIDRRGAKLRQVNPRAVAYALNAGLPLEAVYPGGLMTIRSLAPPAESTESTGFVRLVGLPRAAVYPPVSFSGEDPPQPRRRWAWTAAGMAFGACAGGPLGLAIGGGLGWLGGGR